MSNSSNGAKAANRFRLGLLIALSVTLVLGSFWLIEVLRKSGLAGITEPARTAPDYYVTNFTFVKMAKSQTGRYNISGDRLTHSPVDDSHEITRPVIHNLTTGRPPMVMTSDRALVSKDNTEVQMIGNVVVDRPPSRDTQLFHMTSPYLLLLPEDDVMKTDKPVDMMLGKTQLRGTGMVANNATRQLDLSHRVHGVFPPSAAR